MNLKNGEFKVKMPSIRISDKLLGGSTDKNVCPTCDHHHEQLADTPEERELKKQVASYLQGLKPHTKEAGEKAVV